MRRQDPLILGAGPAGCAAAIALARIGANPLLIDRNAEIGDPLCGGFLSWQTIAQLRDLGVDCAALGAHEVRKLRLFVGAKSVSTALPQAAYGLSRHALDKALHEAAVAAGARFAHDTIRKLEPGCAHGRERAWRSDSIFLASGKEDVRGEARPRHAADPALGLRIRLAPTSERSASLAGTIELHLFEGGYAGMVLQEGGSANVCLAIRKSALARANGDPATLLATLAGRHPHFAARLGDDWQSARTDSIGAVPYGWIARDTQPGLFRLGDQAAVIPSLAGEGIGIALASAEMAVRYWRDSGPTGAKAYQHAFAAAARRPLHIAGLARIIAEKSGAARILLPLSRNFPQILRLIANCTRISVAPSLAQDESTA